MKFRIIYLKNIKNTIAVAILCGFITLTAIYKNNASVYTILPVENKIIIIDAGHGGFDPGKAGVNGEDEKYINLKIAAYLQQYLEESGAVAIITRSTDEALGSSKREDMSERKLIVNESDGDIMISIHQNAFTSGSAKGAQVFYYKNSEEGKRLAEDIQQALCDSLGSTRSAKSNSDYYVLRTTTMPSAIVECGFLSNSDEETKLNTADYQQKTAWAIYKGISDYFNAEK
ncbi:N-acetylmuramoyl-L-alanine amidase [Anaerotignum sp. MSJ-24]|uniref:N-acetylmuramoyl-L-alanine amidase n=1 Tax=Anaerotignum sp. MSJ-24 TaxID=2841521 RepID=UPI001C113013|nr:N-acetylmuramoyl-L-alanine amidase [Anaerotignum sp. MSJ-24]MBU5464340.1 N-acetylmuramoyl-L-alanine amidase [Anaerotignum sp. MSJ-24]